MWDLDTLRKINNRQAAEFLDKKFREAKAAHPEGFTMSLTGKVIRPAGRFAVGTTPEPFGNPTAAALHSLSLMELFPEGNLAIGYDGETGHIDSVFLAPTLDMALLIGRRNKQRTVYDFDTDVCIPCESAGEEAA